MKFWDSSAIVSLIVEEKHSSQLSKLYAQDPVMLAWWGSPIECVSALSRLEREGKLSAENLAQGIARLNELRSVWHEVQPVDVVRDLSCRLLRVHNLRSADSLQLAAAIIASDHRPSTLSFVCADERLSGAAQKEGFGIVGP